MPMTGSQRVGIFSMMVFERITGVTPFWLHGVGAGIENERWPGRQGDGAKQERMGTEIQSIFQVCAPRSGRNSSPG